MLCIMVKKVSLGINLVSVWLSIFHLSTISDKAFVEFSAFESKTAKLNIGKVHKQMTQISFAQLQQVHKSRYDTVFLTSKHT